MKRAPSFVLVSCCLVVAGLEATRRLHQAAIAQPAELQGEAMQMVVGKVVDLTQVLLNDRPEPNAAEDATTAIPPGEPIGLVVDFGQNPQPVAAATTKGLFLLVHDRDNQQASAAFGGLRSLAGQLVQVTGRVRERYGLTALEVQQVTAPPQGHPDE